MFGAKQYKTQIKLEIANVWRQTSHTKSKSKCLALNNGSKVIFVCNVWR